jgi:hypothetical protein
MAKCVRSTSRANDLADLSSHRAYDLRLILASTFEAAGMRSMTDNVVKWSEESCACGFRTAIGREGIDMVLLPLSPDELLSTTRSVRKRLDLTRPVERE